MTIKPTDSQTHMLELIIFQLGGWLEVANRLHVSPEYLKKLAKDRIQLRDILLPHLKRLAPETVDAVRNLPK